MPKQLQYYEHDGLTVVFEPARCIHTARCMRESPAAFDSKARPWVRPDAASREEIVRAVSACPTGALRVYVDGERATADATPVQLTARRNGPLFVSGTIEVVTESGETLMEDLRIALCRCGASARMPLCDNSHRTIGFTTELPITTDESPPADR